MASATLGAIFYIIPIARPFFAPGKGFAADQAILVRQFGFFTHSHGHEMARLGERSNGKPARVNMCFEELTKASHLVLWRGESFHGNANK